MGEEVKRNWGRERRGNFTAALEGFEEGRVDKLGGSGCAAEAETIKRTFQRRKGVGRGGRRALQQCPASGHLWVRIRGRGGIGDLGT